MFLLAAKGAPCYRVYPLSIFRKTLYPRLPSAFVGFIGPDLNPYVVRLIFYFLARMT